MDETISLQLHQANLEQLRQEQEDCAFALSLALGSDAQGKETLDAISAANIIGFGESSCALDIAISCAKADLDAARGMALAMKCGEHELAKARLCDIDRSVADKLRAAENDDQRPIPAEDTVAGHHALQRVMKTQTALELEGQPPAKALRLMPPSMDTGIHKAIVIPDVRKGKKPVVDEPPADDDLGNCLNCLEEKHVPAPEREFAEQEDLASAEVHYIWSRSNLRETLVLAAVEYRSILIVGKKYL